MLYHTCTYTCPHNIEARFSTRLSNASPPPGKLRIKVRKLPGRKSHLQPTSILRVDCLAKRKFPPFDKCSLQNLHTIANHNLEPRTAHQLETIPRMNASASQPVSELIFGFHFIKVRKASRSIHHP